MRDISSTFLNQLFNDEAFIVVHRVHIAHSRVLVDFILSSQYGVKQYDCRHHQFLSFVCVQSVVWLGF